MLKIYIPLWRKHLLFITTLLIITSAFSQQCSYSGQETTAPVWPTISPTCAQQSVTGQGNGSYRYYYIGSTLGNSFLDTYLGTNCGSNACARFNGHQGGVGDNTGYVDNNNTWGTIQGAASSDYILVTTQQGGAWCTSSSTLYYKWAKPGNTPGGITDVTPTFAAAPTTVCAGSNLTFTVNTLSNTTKYVWSVTGVGGTINSGQNSNSVNITFSTAGTATVNVYASNNDKCNSLTASTNVTVYSTTNNPGTITAPAVVCPGATFTVSNATASTSGSPSSSGPSYNFYIRKTDYPNLAGWASVSGGLQGASSYNYTMPNAPGTYEVTRNSAWGCAGESSSNVVTITVYNNFAAGAILADQTVCSSSGPVAFTSVSPAIGGNSSYTYTWQSSSDNVTFTDIASTNSTTYTPPNTVGTIYYRRKVAETSGCFTSPITTGAAQNIAWTNTGVGSNCTINGTTITKTAGTNGGWDGGASGLQAVVKGGYVEFKPLETTGYKMMGLNSDPALDQSYASIDYALYLQAGATISVYENGGNPFNGGTYTTSDVFRVEWNSSNQVVYKKNGVVFYTSTITPSATLYPDCSIYYTGSGFSNVVVQGDDNNMVVNYQNPGTASVGATQNLCGTLTSNALGGNAIAAGTANWSKISGPGTVSFSNANSGSSTATVSAYGTYVLRWTFPANGTCPSTFADITVNFTEAASVGATQNICGSLVSGALGGNTPTIGSGAWSKISGPGTVTFSASTSGSSTATVSAYGIYVLRWTVTGANSGCSSFADVTVNYTEAASVGATQNICSGLTSATLGGNTPTVGTGLWTKISGPGTVTFSASTSGSSTATVSAYGTYVLRWTVTGANSGCSSFADVTVSYTEAATVGATQNICSGLVSATLGGNTPTVGSGTWTKTSGPGTVTFSAANSGSSTATVSAYGTYVLRWTVSGPNALCSSFAEITVAYTEAATVGATQYRCGTLLSTALGGNTPTVGSGTWTKTSGPGTVTFSAANSGSSTATVSAYGTYVLRWTVSGPNALCSSFAEITVRYAEQATVGSSPQNVTCNTLTSQSLGGNTPSVGTGTWSFVSGAGVINAWNPNTNTPGATVTVSSFGTYNLRWTIDNTGCSTSADIVVNFSAQNSISGNNTICDFPLAATYNYTSSPPTSNWSVNSGSISVSGNTGVFDPADVASPTATQTVIITATNGTCSANYPVTVYNKPVITNSTSSLCEGNTLNLSSDITSGISWDVTGNNCPTCISGVNGNIFTAPDPGSNSATYTFTATNGQCFTIFSLQVDRGLVIGSPTATCDNTNQTFTSSPAAYWSITSGPGSLSNVGVLAISSLFTPPNLTPPTQNAQTTIHIESANGACKYDKIIRTDNQNGTPNPTSPICAASTSTISGDVNGVVWTTSAGSITSPGLNTTLSGVTIPVNQSNVNVTVTATNGTCTPTTATVVVYKDPSVAISGQTDVCVGGSVTLTASAQDGTGISPNYLWERSPNGVNSWTTVQNSASTTYATSTSLAAGNYYYRVTLTQNGGCSAVSANVSANVVNDPSISLDPVDLNVCRGGNGSLVVSATGGTPTLLYEWEYDNTGIVTDGSPAGVDYSGETTNTLSIVTANNTPVGNIPLWVKVYATGNGCDATYSLFADLNINADPVVTNPTPAVQSGVCAGSTASPISVSASGGFGAFSYQWYSNTINSTVGGTLISGATSSSYSPVVSNGTLYYYCVVTQNIPSAGCGPVTSGTAQVSGSPNTLSGTVVVDECMNFAVGDKYYVLVSGVNGNPPYSYTGAFYTTTFNQGLYEINAGTSSSYTITDNSGCIYTTNSVTAPSGRPTNIAFNSSTGNLTTDCWVNNFNKWVTFRDSVANNAVLALNDNQNNLGLVTVDVYKDATPPVIYNNPLATNCTWTQHTAMRRHFKLSSTLAPVTGVDVMLFFTDQEYLDLKADAWNNNTGYPNPEYACTELDDVYSFNDIYVTKYTGANEDGNYLNNSPSGLYRVYGDNTTPNRPLIKGQYTGNGTGFQGIYGGVNTHHYVQMTVTEFSEFWIHGSQQSQALPVEMIYIQADVINNTYVRLSWATAVEVNNKGFEVERSVDGQNWAQIGWIDGNNNSTVQSNYHFDDMDVISGSTYYYRLKQVDNDEAFEYTDIVSARLNGAVTFTVGDFKPNPTIDKTNLVVVAAVDQEITVMFYNLVGQKVMESSHSLNKGNNKIGFEIGTLASGTYTAVITSGNEVYTRKIILTK